MFHERYDLVSFSGNTIYQSTVIYMENYMDHFQIIGNSLITDHNVGILDFSLLIETYLDYVNFENNICDYCINFRENLI